MIELNLNKKNMQYYCNYLKLISQSSLRVSSPRLLVVVLTTNLSLAISSSFLCLVIKLL